MLFGSGDPCHAAYDPLKRWVDGLLEQNPKNFPRLRPPLKAWGFVAFVALAAGLALLALLLPPAALDHLPPPPGGDGDDGGGVFKNKKFFARGSEKYSSKTPKSDDQWRKFAMCVFWLF